MTKSHSDKISFDVDSQSHGQRLDKVLAQNPELIELGLTRSQIKHLIDKNQVTVNQKIESRAGLILKAGDLVVLERGQPDMSATSEYDFPLSIFYEDDELIVIDKPAGLTVHPGANTAGKTLLNALIHYYQKNGATLPQVFASLANSRGGIVHRLDKDTTGVIVVAKTLKSLQALSKQFSERSTKRLYQALVFSTPRGNRIISEEDQGIIDLPIGRDPLRRVAMSVQGLGQRNAVTEWKVESRFSYATLLELSLKTGRTHQIRVHMNAIGSPVIGDRTYGDFSGLPLSLQKVSQQFGRQALHAKYLGFIHPGTGSYIDFYSKTPQDMLDLIQKFSLKLTRDSKS